MAELTVLVGSASNGLRFAEERGWADAQYAIVTTASVLKALDPTDILQIIMINPTDLGQQILEAIINEINCLTDLWPVPVCMV